MTIDLVQGLLMIIFVALMGGIVAKLLKLPVLVGYLAAGVIARTLFPHLVWGGFQLSQLGLIFLLFSVGLDISPRYLRRVIKPALVGAVIQVAGVTLLGYWVARAVGLEAPTALILSLGLSLSSTAVVVRILMDNGETQTLHGEVMVGWLLVQDLAVIIMLVIVTFFGQGSGLNYWHLFASLVKAVVIIVGLFVFGRKLVPVSMRLVSSLNSRELLVFLSVGLIFITALGAAFFGLPAALGAFLAGVVLSDSLAKYAVLAEIRPLRDLVVGIFFVSLGLLVTPSLMIPNLAVIFALTALVLVIKVVINCLVCVLLGYHGKTALTISVGLSQVGEFAFVIYSLAYGYHLISDTALTIGLTVALVSLMAFPLFYPRIPFFWRQLKRITARWPGLHKWLAGWDQDSLREERVSLEGHVVVCGYGRVGEWVGRALTQAGVDLVVVETDQQLANRLREQQLSVIYGDPVEKEVLEAAGIIQAKALVVAIPDRVAQEGVITLAKTLSPKIKIITRVNTDDDWERLKLLQVDKIIQPEFEAAVAITRNLLSVIGRSPLEIKEKIKSLRLSRARRV